MNFAVSQKTGKLDGMMQEAGNMKTFSFDFSLADFVAYFVPGTILMLDIVGILILTPLQMEIKKIPINAGTIIIAIPVAYFLGVFASSLAYRFGEKRYLSGRISNPRKEIPLETHFRKQVVDSFNRIFGDHGDWSEDHFFISRSLIRQLAPELAASAERQNSLWQLRRNSVIPTICLGLVCIFWSVKAIISWKEDFQYIWGIAFLLLSLALPYIIICRKMIEGMHRNRRREAREICTGLMALANKDKSKP